MYGVKVCHHLIPYFLKEHVIIKLFAVSLLYTFVRISFNLIISTQCGYSDDMDVSSLNMVNMNT